ncbi:MULTISPECIES: ATP synthase F1 subunit gamma [Psychrilyobacter]|uniref:ATP synthase gamma chain n=1 Tax=Psychrilyobacter piezotolerans TaxID=2293438 RepID=A0ABX9KDL6_9FUSO|nr:MULTISPECIES: ATP synthase F1 subunit gamma [Psychrilyobacter]MCS5422177.1 ATP synthase F1 subunit gamma [Psychrilyobacter sp. S5]NDI77680.1 ATP synthase F1 subunit gamma [Psychrilyobacter piezotolerans]RDE59070.1 ATP synthase F1 subunit gamma [Psychrilyobacter sp. S5]REI39642.1 ATP synthase F1 subunit gamma [Psychrilyobacter piezotolerans]
MAANIKEIKSRIKGVQSTHKITKAMEVVSSTKFKRYSKLVGESRPYSEAMDGILRNIATGIKNEKNSLFDGKAEVKKIGVVLMTSDRGLCGGFNSQANKALERLKAENPDKKVSIIAVGKKGRDYCKKRDYDLKGEYIQLIPESMFEKAKEISENIVDFYLEDIFDEVYIIYSKFVSAVSSDLTTKRLIPIEKVESESNEPYIFEPSAEYILSTLLPKYLNIVLYQAILDNTASEHAARKTAMKNATDNADELVGSLTLQFNRARQAAITQEIAEIVSGSLAQQ